MAGVKKVRKYIWGILIPVLLAGCGAEANTAADAASGQDYGTQKQMVIDILNSSDGKKALAEVLQDPNLKTQWLVSQTDVSQAMEKALTSGGSQSLLAQQLKDPKFAAALAKAIEPELISQQKQLMKDPEYQKDLQVLLKSPGFTTQLQDLMQTPEFRGNIMKVMTDALKTPSFRMQFQDALKSAVAEQMQSAGSSSGQSGGSSGGGGGGGDSQGGGSQKS